MPFSFLKRILSLLLLILLLTSVSSIAQPTRKLDSLVSIHQTLKEDTNKVNVSNQISEVLWRMSRYPEAMKYSQEAMDLATKLDFKRGQVKSYRNFSSIHTFLGKYQDALLNMSKEQTLRRELNDMWGISTTYINMGIVHYYLGDYKKAFEIYEEGLKGLEKLNAQAELASAYSNMGILYKSTGNLSAALNNYLKSLAILQKRDDSGFLPAAYINIGNIYFAQGNYPEAIVYYFKSLKASEALGDQEGVGLCYLNIGKVNALQTQHDEALTNYRYALNILQKINNRKGVSSAYENIAALYNKANDLDNALANFSSALKIKEEIGDKVGIASCLHNIGNIYSKQGKYKEALIEFNKSIEISDKNGYKSNLANSYVSIGGIYTMLGKWDEARAYIDKGLKIAKETKGTETLMYAYLGMAQLDSIEQNYKSAYENYKLYDYYSDSLVRDREGKKVLQAQMEYKFYKKEDSLKYVNVLTQEELKRQTLLARQNEQALLLNRNQLELTEKEAQIKQLAYLNSQSQLRAEQNKLSESERQLEAINQQRNLQKATLNLQDARLKIQQLDIKEKRSQRNLLVGGVAGLLLLSFFIFYALRNQVRINKLNQVTAEKRQAELQLQSLRAQLNPHFMFNSLNAIQELILKQENEKSQSYLERFAQLLRSMLENANQPFISLRKEIDFLKLYLSLEKLRIPDLHFSINIDPSIDPDRVQTPNMMLQPYLENALWHGLQYKEGEKKLELNITKGNGRLNYQITDNGIGRKKAAELKSAYQKAHKSKGMELLSKRFSLLSKEYGEDIITDIADISENGESAGTAVLISVPASLARNRETVAS